MTIRRNMEWKIPQKIEWDSWDSIGTFHLIGHHLRRVGPRSPTGKTDTLNTNATKCLVR